MVNAVNVTRLPKAPHDLKTVDERKVRIAGPGPMRNVGWLATTFFTGVLWTNQVILNLVIPLWLVDKTDAPWVVLGFLFATNTVMCIVLPMAAARGVKDTRTALRAIRISTAFFVVSCVITLSTHESIGWATITLFFLGHITLTGAELFLSAASWTFEAELMDPRRRGEYQGASELSGTLGRVWAPAAFTFLAMNWGAIGWMIIAGIITAAAVALHPSTAMARRFLEKHVPADVLADAAAHEVDGRRRPGRSPDDRAAGQPGCAGRALRGRRPGCLNPPVASPSDWLAGARPRTLPAAVAPVLAGTGVAAYVDGAVWWKALLALVVSLALQVGVNYANDYSDGIRGTDADRVGPMRLVGSGTASPGAVKAAAFAAFGVAAVAGLVLAATTAWWLVAVGLVCVLAAWFYTGGSRPYGYLGLGEVMVFVFFGLVAVVGTTYVQTETFEWAALYAAVGVGALACAILVANNLRDIPTDVEAGKRTLAVKLGAERTRGPLRPAGAGRGAGRGRRRGRHDVVGAPRARVPAPDGPARPHRPRWRGRTGAGAGAPADRGRPAGVVGAGRRTPPPHVLTPGRAAPLTTYN